MPEVRDHDRWARAQPALLAPDPGRVLRSAEVAGRGPEVDPLDERALRLAHDHEHLAGVDRDLARAAGAGQARLGMLVVADDGVLMLPNRSICAAPRKPDVDQAALQVEAEQLEHARSTAVAPVTIVGSPMRQRQPGRPGPEDARLVDQLQVRRDRPLGQVDGDVRQARRRRSRRAGRPARGRRPRSSSRTARRRRSAAAGGRLALICRPRSRPSRTAPARRPQRGQPLGAELRRRTRRGRRRRRPIRRARPASAPRRG